MERRKGERGRSESDANTKMAALDTADSTNRRYKVMEV